jgi:tripartite-type tricarboxylate transporter receptor subunit TctC
MPHVQAGTLKILAVTTAQRLPSLPDVPTVQEVGVSGYEVELWHGLIAPKGVPRAIVDKINKLANDALKLKEAAEKLAGDGVSPAGGTPEEFGATIAKEVELWRKLAADGVIKAP